MYVNEKRVFFGKVFYLLSDFFPKVEVQNYSETLALTTKIHAILSQKATCSKQDEVLSSLNEAPNHVHVTS